MIRRAVYTWTASEAELGQSEWPSVAYHRWAWEFSVARALEFFDEVALYANAEGLEQLGDLPGLTETHNTLDDWVGADFPELWGVAKMDTQARQKVPFLHIDGDVFLWKRPKDAPAICQCHEKPGGRDYRLCKWLRRHGFYDVGPYPGRVFNVGVWGGTDLAALHRYAAHGLKHAPAAAAARRQAIGRPDPDLNFVYEQYAPAFFVDAVPVLPRDTFEGPELSHLVRAYRRSAPRLVQLETRARQFGFAPPLELVFDRVYHTGTWTGEGAPPSGAGSALSVAQPFALQLAATLQALGTRSFLDVGCGDWTWLEHLADQVFPAELTYFGVDVAETRLRATETAHGSERRLFHVGDATDASAPFWDALPSEIDLALVRDVFIHLPNAQILDCLRAMRARGVKRVLLPSYPGALPSDVTPGDFRPVDLQSAPFNLPEPEMWLPDNDGKRVGLWRADQLPGR